MGTAFELGMDELRAVTAYAADCADMVLDLFERHHPADRRPRDAVTAARAFAGGGKRGKGLRDVSWAALRSAQDAHNPASEHAARAAMAASAAAYLHPLPSASQVKHILGAAAHAARAAELDAGDSAEIGVAGIQAAARMAGATVVMVLRRYPSAPAGGGRVGELLRLLDATLRSAGQ